MIELTPAQAAILRKLERGREITWYIGRHSSIRYDGLPKGATREDVWALRRAGYINETAGGRLELGVVRVKL